VKSLILIESFTNWRRPLPCLYLWLLAFRHFIILNVLIGQSIETYSYNQIFNISGPRIWNGLPEDVLFRRRHFQVSGADLNPSSSSSHMLILSSNCAFDTIVVLVVMFIT